MSQGLGMALDEYIKASKFKNRNENQSFGRYKPNNNNNNSGGTYNKFRRFKPQGGFNKNNNNRFARNENFEPKFKQVIIVVP